VKLKTFGEIETTWSEQSLSDLIGHIDTLIRNEDERTEGRKPNGILDVRLEIVEEAYGLLQIVDNGDHRIMRETLRRIRNQGDVR